MLDAEADAMCKAQRYERSPDRIDNRAGVSVRRVEDTTEALWGTRVSPSTVSKLNQKFYKKLRQHRAFSEENLVYDQAQALIGEPAHDLHPKSRHPADRRGGDA